MFPVLSANTLSTGYNLTNSLRFRSSASAYLSRTFGTPTSAYTWTISFWTKLGANVTTQGPFIGAGASNPFLYTTIGPSGLQFFAPNTGATIDMETTQLFRDPSAWYHIVIAVDTTQATASNRFKMYINGTQVTSFLAAGYPALNSTFYWNQSGLVHKIGANSSAGTFFDGYMTEWNFIDGQALTPSSFGSTNATTGVWQPAKYTGTYGTNGFYLNFSSIALTSGSNTGLGQDFSGNANYWTTNNISVTAGTTYDAMTDVPTLTSATVANYAVLSPIDQVGGPPSGGNLDLTISAGTSNCVAGTIAVSSGKWYWEVTIGSTTNANWMVGIADSAGTIASRAYTGANGWYYFTNGNKYNNNTGTAYGASYTTGDIIGIALDMDAGTLVFYKNNTSQGTAYSSLTGKTMQAALGNGGGASTQTYNINFGQRPFSYTPPTGFVALNTYNLPTPTILQGNKYMDATLYTGTGATATITNAAGFKPDLVWVKSRSAATDHKLTDSVRGVQKGLISDTTGAETTDTNGLTAFNSNGWSLGTDTVYNNNAATYVGWQWQAGQGSSSSNTSGSITSTVSVNASAGFSVVTYTGNNTLSTVGHGLGVGPKFIIVKTRSGTDNWIVYHASLGVQYYSLLNTTAASYNNLSNYWGSTAPSSTTFSINAYGGVNTNAATYVAYCWAEISGYSKAFSYTGNGSTDGSFVYTGFLPRFVLIKRTDTTGDWYMWDTARNTYDVITNTLLANSSAAETSATSIDALSNGFKLRNTTAGFNASGGTYIGIAWATNPFKNSNAF